MPIRNVAVIAHVDHGKTTLIDGLLKQTHIFRDNQVEMGQRAIMDQGELEREKGITILAKNTAINYQGIKINIIDTPGHADFGGEVERVINMADGALLIVDSSEGPQPQTKFVLEQAIKQKLKMIVVINKIDRKDARIEEVLAETEDLFLQMADSDDQLMFPVIYAIGRQGKAWKELPADPSAPADLQPLFEQILATIPEPQVDPNQPFKMLVSNLDFDNYKGSYAIGKIAQGTINRNQTVQIWRGEEKMGSAKAEHLFVSRGLEREEVESCQAGDIIAITGIESIGIGQTLAASEVTAGFPEIKVTEPTLKIKVAPNTSPLAGREGEFCTARQLHDRLQREKKTNLGLRIEPSPTGPGFMVSGRGQLHLAVLLEQMRREGYEMEVSRPEVIYKEIAGEKMEPVEEMIIEIDENYMGIITEEFGRRKGQLTESFTNSKGKTKMVYRISSQNLLGFRSNILTKTRGNGIFNSQFIGYFPVSDHAKQLRNGVVVATDPGTVTKYAMQNAQERGQLCVRPGDQVYEGLLVGLATRPQDIDLNICKAKQMTNFRSNADVDIPVDEPMEMSLEKALDFIENDELAEITPLNIRIRKKILARKERTKKVNQEK